MDISRNCHSFIFSLKFPFSVKTFKTQKTTKNMKIKNIQSKPLTIFLSVITLLAGFYFIGLSTITGNAIINENNFTGLTGMLPFVGLLLVFGSIILIIYSIKRG